MICVITPFNHTVPPRYVVIQQFNTQKIFLKTSQYVVYCAYMHVYVRMCMR